MATNYTLITLAIIAGCGVCVLLGWAVAHQFFPDTTTSSRHQHEGGMEFDQQQYMREVRLRHHEDLAAMFGGRRVLDNARRDAKSWYGRGAGRGSEVSG
ncbi:hypothetical protein BAUCODRAFT_144143 [Baudoinia panamericana UAMH 10762]|uniref:Uncharacterized protein n=1 Tax=Baudoinia panamericana (strain UAMH 10762) TaxID=717646 RepID=M2N8L1_BAUPA|nr:uncharacterized protein BAUCODRAFT_144143 [Baudoinia panamericana UAMH 10762]EMD00479.1 hypothetical protein BAUCODRAFT_144143 [Baudoinia panamericana UAMH 10762]